MFSIGIYAFSKNRAGIGLFLIFLSCFFAFLKLYDLTGLYPRELWGVFNLLQSLLFYFIFQEIVKIQNFYETFKKIK